jgi:2-keto-4-pentenoate hydratase/2-oxohepta-3-ene-1,7-dioic acid hydratase in catechol pathway
LANLELVPNGAISLGVETTRGVVVVPSAAKKLGLPAPQDMGDLLQHGRAEEVSAVLDALDTLDSRAGEAVLLDPAEVRFAPLVTRPQKIVCVGFNYREHAEETGTPIPKAPPLFNKYNNSLNRHGGTITLPTRVGLPVRLRDGAGDRDGPRGPQRRRGSSAGLCSRLRDRQ